MDYLRNIRLEQNARALLAIIDEVKQCLDEVSLSLKEFIPDSNQETQSQYDHFQPADIFRTHKTFLLSLISEENSHEKANHETTSNGNAAIVRKQKTHRMINDRPQTPISKFPSTAESIPTIADDSVDILPSNDQEVEQEMKKKEKEWIFPSLVLRKCQSQTENCKCEDVSNGVPTELCAEQCLHEQSLQDSAVSNVKSFFISPSSPSTRDNNWKYRYAINGYDQAESVTQTMTDIKDDVMYPSEFSNLRSVSFAFDASSVFIDDKIRDRSVLIGKLQETDSHESTLSLQSFEEEKNLNPQLKFILSQYLKRQPSSKCRKHRVFCIDCGQRFKPDQDVVDEENRNRSQNGKVKQLVDKWETTLSSISSRK